MLSVFTLNDTKGYISAGISRLPHSLISSGQDASYTLRLGEAGTTFDMEFSDGIVHISEEAPSSYDVRC